MHPDQLPEMLSQFKSGGYAYNEAVVDGKGWNDGVAENLWAFIVPIGSMSECGPETTCYKDFAKWYNNFKAQHGSKTILGFDATNQNAPFSPFPEPEPDA